MKLLLSVSLGLIIAAQPAAAIEDVPLHRGQGGARGLLPSARGGTGGPAQARTVDHPIEPIEDVRLLQQMRRDDEEVYRSMRGICRGC